MGFDLNLSPDQRHILDAAAEVLARHYPLNRAHGREDLTPLADFGTFALTLPEEQGGAGMSLVEEALLYRAFGHSLIAPQALAQSLAARMGHEGPVCAALPAGADYLVFGQGPDAVIFTPYDIALGQVTHRTPVQGLGHSLPLSRGMITPLRQDTGQHDKGHQDTQLRAIADLLICAILTGIAEASRDLALEYAQTRSQFGRPIGSFQAIKHHLADMHIAAESLSALGDIAALAMAESAEDAAFQLAALRHLAPRHALANARACIQIHGGIGFTDEASPHLFLKAAHLWGQLLGAENLADQHSPMRPDFERTTA